MITLYSRIEGVTLSGIGSIDGEVITATVPSVVYGKQIDEYIVTMYIHNYIVIATAVITYITINRTLYNHM